MGLKIYNHSKQIFVDIFGQTLARVTEVELKLDSRRTDSRVLWISYDDKEVQQVFTEKDVEFIELNLEGGYAIRGTGTLPIFMCNGKTLSYIQQAHFLYNNVEQSGFLELKIVAKI
jgi:hypothetical protein